MLGHTVGGAGPEGQVARGTGSRMRREAAVPEAHSGGQEVPVASTPTLFTFYLLAQGGCPAQKWEDTLQGKVEHGL